ncbi:MAG TPA: DUF389 domain-containing protein [Pyrinomonadaceae bacterium]|nr:DUF389 domain-containing protein [Pyrinomonadaceae bacterium]
MRLVKVAAPEGKAAEIAQLAFGVGIGQVSTTQEVVYHDDGSSETKDVVNVDTATPKAKAFVEAVLSAPFFDRQKYSINIREPRAIYGREHPSRVTRPFALPETDLLEELWQFSHVTLSFVGRVLVGSLLLAFGMVQANLLFMIAGLLFLPFLPLILAMGFGTLAREWRLVGQGLLAFVVGTGLILLGGVIIGLLTEPPLKFQEFNPMLTSILFSVAVGIAAALATSDDVGRREMIGLAASSQVAIIPAWLGVSLVFGFPRTDTGSPVQRSLTFLINIVAIIVTSLITYALIGMRGSPLRRAAEGSTKEG